MATKEQIEELNIGPNIKEVRLKHNMTQAQLAQLLGKSVSTICGYENNTILPPMKVLFKIEALLDTTIGDLMNFKSNLASGAAIAQLIDKYSHLLGEDEDDE